MNAIVPKSLIELRALILASGVSIERDFKRLHHFSKPNFATPPSSFAEFVSYCESLTQGIRPGEQNEQTIQRTFRFVELLQEGQGVELAIEQAWAQFPLAGQS